MKLRIAELLLCLSLLARAAGAESSTNELRLDTILERVRRENPGVKAARANAESMKERIRQARAWEDPMAGVDVERMNTTRFHTFTDNEWMISQKLPISGKNRRQAKAAEAEALGALEELRRRELDAVAQAKAAYYRLANAHKQQELNIRNEELLRQFAEISRARYEVGRGEQADVLLAETDLARLMEERYELGLQVSEAESLLNTLMNQPVGAPLGRPLPLTFSPLPAQTEQIASDAAAGRPEIVLARKRIEAAKARLTVAKRYWIPDPEVRVEARQYNGEGGIQEYDTGLFFNLPWLSRAKYRAAIGEAEKNVESAELLLAEARNESGRMLRDQLRRVETFHHHAELFRDKIVPLAEQAIKANQTAYEAGRGGFLELITAQRTLREVEAAYWQHLTDYLSAIAQLETIVGAELPSR
jgi:outer membrane protein, heavy metal efflux system